MQLSLFTDIALKSVIYLKQSTKLVTINEIAEQFGITRNHLVKVLNFMVHKGWINSTRGRNGGLLYNSMSDNLKLGDVIMILENKDELLDCSNCILKANCCLRGILYQAQLEFFKYLNQYTLKDLNDEPTASFLTQRIAKLHAIKNV
ncbi:MAG: Rrf2 family transcriptional regulator [Burkholderiales bacterium]|nr:Rrf2 family transcriptional regulator [Burkholderiales bacterium]